MIYRIFIYVTIHYLDISYLYKFNEKINMFLTEMHFKVI